MLTKYQIRISMDGRGCWRDQVFVERQWRSVKYEEVYLHAYESVSAAKAGIGKYFAFYNARRSHTALERKTPDNVYFKSITPLPLAAAA
jgi:putative transposase